VAARLAMVAALVLGGCDKAKEEKAAAGADPGTAAPAKLRIAVVPKGTTHDFWKTVHAGAMRAGKDLGVEVTFRGPEREDDREQQVSLVQNLISGKYSAIVLAPLDDRALVSPVKQATQARIPVVIIDSGLEATAGTDFVSFVATDNRRGGELAGQKLGELLGGKGSVLLLRYQEGSASTGLREEGFVEAIKRFPGITLIDPKRYAGVTRATAQEAAENLLSANSDIAGVFCSNESATYGMLLALRGRGMAGKVKFVGFDASEPLVAALKSGEIDALAVQNPMKMGYEGVKAAVDHLRGRTVELRIDTGVGLVTGSTVDTPAMKDLIAPDLSVLTGSGAG
jgi:ribose transport system substrate-binding protein